jgi:hypothetical protein
VDVDATIRTATQQPKDVHSPRLFFFFLFFYAQYRNTTFFKNEGALAVKLGLDDLIFA